MTFLNRVRVNVVVLDFQLGPVKTVVYGLRTLRYLGPKIWSNLIYIFIFILFRFK